MLFTCLLGNFFSSFLAKSLYILIGLNQKFILKLNVVNFNMQTEVKLSWIAKCYSYDIIKLLTK